MSGFIEGENRHQSTLFPERVDDYVEEDSVVRVIDVFIDRLDISGLGFKAEAADTSLAGLSPSHDVEDLRVWISQPSPLISPIRTRSATQCGADVADRSTGPGLQDHRQFPQG